MQTRRLELTWLRAGPASLGGPVPTLKGTAPKKEPRNIKGPDWVGCQEPHSCGSQHQQAEPLSTQLGPPCPTSQSHEVEA